MLQKLKRSFSSFKPLRNPLYQSCTNDDINYFKSFLKENQVLTENLDFYNNDWMKMYTGNSKVCLLPDTTEKVRKILQYCYSRQLAVVPQGGNTGVVGGSIPVFDEIVLSLSKMNQIIKFNQQNNVLTAESGVILENANQFLLNYNCEIPWDLGAKGSCVIGGNVSTHAGGQYFLKYGPMRANILGMEVVLANGEVLDMRSEIRKDNTGIDLKQLFIGSEGSLGVITKLNILCRNIDKHKNLLLIKCNSYESILTLYQHSRSIFSSNLSAIEWMDGSSFNLVIKECKESVNNPFESNNQDESNYYLLVEVNSDSQELQQHYLETIMQVDGFKDCVKAENAAQYKQLWSIREMVAPATTKSSQVAIGYDVSLDISKMDELTKIIRNKLQKYDCVVCGFGHIGDSNLHLNLAVNNKSERNDIEHIIEPFIYEYTAQHKGSISAEHGMGQMKSLFLPLQKSPLQIELMKKLKLAFDDKQILNPYKIWPI